MIFKFSKELESQVWLLGKKNGDFSHNEGTDALAECPQLFWLLERRAGPAVITAAIRWLNIIMFCWNWIYWSMNHSAQVLPNCSKRCGWEGWRGSFSWRSLQNDCARVCMFTPAHARTPHTLQKTSSAASSSVVMWRLAGNVCRANCGFFCRPPPPRIYEQLTIWLPQTGPLWLLSGALRLLTGRFNPYSPSSDPPLLGGYLGEALGAIGQLQNYNLNPHGCPGEANSKPMVSAWEPLQPRPPCLVYREEWGWKQLRTLKHCESPTVSHMQKV